MFLNNPATGLPSSLTADGSGDLSFSARWIQSTNGAASAPPMALTGTWFTGGTSTTTKPQFLIEPAGTTSANWNTAGTGFGVNAPTGFTGDLAWFGVGGSNLCRIASSGAITHRGLRADASTITDNLILEATWGTNNPHVRIAGSNSNIALQFTNTGRITWGSSWNTYNPDLILQRGAPNTHAWRNGTNAQTGWLFNTYTNDSNYERLALKWSSNVFQIEPEAAGTGVVRPLQFPANGIANTPPVSLTGTWFSGGLASTTKPQFLIEPAGTTSTNWSTAGTGFGVNAPSGFGGNLLDLQVNGVSRFKFDNGNKRFHLYTDGTRGDCYFDRSGGGGDPALVATGTTLDFNFTSFRGVNAARFHGEIASSPNMPANYSLDGYVLTSAQLELWGYSTQQNRKIIGGNRSIQDEIPIHFEVRARDRPSGTSSWVNTLGSHLYLAGGAAVTAATNAAHGGNIYLDGGRGYGTGFSGNIIIGQTRGDLEFANQRNLVFGTTTGTKIGAATNQKFAFWNATPIAQPAAVADATDATSAVTQLNLALATLRTLGLIAT